MAQIQQKAPADKRDERTAHVALLRKTRAGQAEHQSRVVTLAKALRVTTARVANDMFELAMSVIGLTTHQHSADQLKEVLKAEDALLLLLDGSDGRRGGAVLDSALVGALIQQQTTGQVLPTPPDGPRPMTATDAAICAPFIDAVLAGAASLPDTARDRAQLTGYSFGARAEEMRLLLMALEAPEYQVARLTLDIAEGQRQGQLLLCLPVVAAEETSTKPDAASASAAQEADRKICPRMTDQVMALKAELLVMLGRTRMPISKLGELSVGDALPLDHASFDQVRVLTLDRRCIAQGALGQIDQMRALQIAPLDRQISTAGQWDSEKVKPMVSKAAPIPDQSNAQPASVGDDVVGGEKGAFADLPDIDDLDELTDMPGLLRPSDLAVPGQT